MRESLIEYFDGQTARPILVRVLLFQNSIHIYNLEDGEIILIQPLSTCYTTQVNNRLFIYLSGEGTKYLVLESGHPFWEEIVALIRRFQHDWFSRLIKRRLVVLIGLFLVLLSGCYFVFIKTVPAIGLKLISVNQEIALGNKLHQTLVNREKIDTNESKKAQAFADALHLSDRYPIHVTVVRDQEVNAFALPGGFVVINEGILQQMQSYDELAALLGHEVSHINGRHSLRSMLNQLSISVFLSISIGDITGLSSLIVGNAEKLRNLSYSRKLETEADQKGMELMIFNRIHPEGMQNLMKRLQVTHSGIPVIFLSTHPLTEERIEHVKRFISQLPQTTFVSHSELEELWRSLKDKE